MPAQIVGPAYELRLGDLREVWADVPDGSIDTAVVDPPYSQQFIPLFEDVGSLLARVLKPGRLAAIYCGHMSFPEEIRLLEAGGLTYVWHGVNLLPGRHSRIHGRMVNGKHRSVLLLSAGPFRPRRWIHDTFFAEGRGGPDTRPLHPWQQAVEPMAALGPDDVRARRGRVRPLLRERHDGRRSTHGRPALPRWRPRPGLRRDDEAAARGAGRDQHGRTAHQPRERRTAMSITTALHKVKETTGFVAFETDPDSEPVFGTTYVHKEGFAKLGSPEIIIVTVEAG